MNRLTLATTALFATVSIGTVAHARPMTPEDVAKLEKLEHKLERFSRASLALAAIAAALGYVLGKRHLL